MPDIAREISDVAKNLSLFGLHDCYEVAERASTEIIRLRDEVEYLKGQLTEQDKQAARAIEDAAYDAECEAERELQRGIRSREDGWG